MHVSERSFVGSCCAPFYRNTGNRHCWCRADWPQSVSSILHFRETKLQSYSAFSKIIMKNCWICTTRNHALSYTGETSLGKNTNGNGTHSQELSNPCTNCSCTIKFASLKNIQWFSALNVPVIGVTKRKSLISFLSPVHPTQVTTQVELIYVEKYSLMKFIYLFIFFFINILIISTMYSCELRIAASSNMGFMIRAAETQNDTKHLAQHPVILYLIRD